MNRERGVALIGMAMVTVLFASIIFATIYVGLFAVSKSMMEAGIGRAMDLAVIDPRFSETPPDPENPSCTGSSTLGKCCDSMGDPGTNNNSHPWCQAFVEIRAEALRLPTSSVVQMEIESGFAYIDPDIRFDRPFRMHVPFTVQDLKDNPITMEVQYGYLDVTGKWSDRGIVKNFAFYEVASKPVYNVPSDCFGNPQHSPEFNQDSCDECPAADNQASAIVNGVRRCYPCSVLAPLASATNDTNHGPKKYPNSECWCPSEGYCNSLYNDGNPLSMDVNNNCRCVCPSSQGYTTDPITGRCVCASTPPPYYGHTFTNGRDENCDCDPPVTQQVCDDAFGVGVQEPHPSGCKCRCPTGGNNACQNGTLNNTTCDCTCKNEWVDDPNGARCSVCPSSAQIICESGGGIFDHPACLCKPDCSVIDDAYYDPGTNTCKCICGGNPGSCIDCGGVTGE